MAGCAGCFRTWCLRGRWPVKIQMSLAKVSWCDQNWKNAGARWKGIGRGPGPERCSESARQRRVVGATIMRRRLSHRIRGAWMRSAIRGLRRTAPCTRLPLSLALRANHFEQCECRNRMNRSGSESPSAHLNFLSSAFLAHERPGRDAAEKAFARYYAHVVFRPHE